MHKLKIALLCSGLTIGLMAGLTMAKASPGGARAKTELVKTNVYHPAAAVMQICPAMDVVNQAPALPATASFMIEREQIKLPIVKITSLLIRPGWQRNEPLSLYSRSMSIGRKPPLIL